MGIQVKFLTILTKNHEIILIVFRCYIDSEEQSFSPNATTTTTTAAPGVTTTTTSSMLLVSHKKYFMSN